jgi:hypothetical protein
MKATTLHPLISVKQRVSLTDAEPRQSDQYHGRLWLPETAVIQYVPEPDTGRWEVTGGGFNLYGRILKLNGQPSSRRHPGVTVYNWGSDPLLTVLADILRPGGIGHFSFVQLSEFEVKA